MKRWRDRWWLVLCCALGLVFAGPASAGRILVLVHGYLGDSDSWRQSGVLPLLQQAGWEVAGNWQENRYGAVAATVDLAEGEHDLAVRMCREKGRTMLCLYLGRVAGHSPSP